MAELADALDLGSSGNPRAGSSPVTRTKWSVHNGFELWTLVFISIASFHICIEQDLSRSFVLCSLAAYLTATLIRVAALYQLLRCLKLNLSG